ncbi:hypothetical protein Cfor_05103 [Coptotermes formosanus]|uniref:NADH dehydrogenase [ubiquinone] 1 beta subcomplex subunit 4 n=1 Tax=Coptotermes formosanus TaxID=36987 RepID=A0A6L2PRD1_COPFO|nr:hypothetical protein Cfor_05103 [Coptotermes formosanus]
MVMENVLYNHLTLILCPAMDSGTSCNFKMTFLLHHEFTKTFPLEFVAAYQLTNLTRSHEVKFDSGIQRFMSMRATEYDHFRATPKTSLYGLCSIVLPMLAFGYLLKTSRDAQEHKYRTGQVAYKDRRFKFI